jgi:hypothetical protein
MSSTPQTRHFERFCVDLIKLAQSKLSNEYAIVFIDSFTRWPEVIPFPYKTASTIIRVKKEYNFARHGMPNYLLSDESSEYLNQLVADVCKLYGVTKVFSAAYHSRGHGMVERLNRTIEDRLKHTANQACEHRNVWLLYGLDPILPIYNALLNHIHPDLWLKLRQTARLLTRLTTPARPLTCPLSQQYARAFECLAHTCISS